MELIGQGAEAKIFKIDSNTLLKIRDKKEYRLEIIDKKLRKSRNKREFKILKKLFENKVNVPEPFKLNEKNINFTFKFIDGIILKETLNKETLFLAFKEIIKMHNLDIIHGDLTTLNMIESKNKIYIIDFGLSQISLNIEEKAVDLNLFFTCIRNEHKNYFKYKNDLIKEYLKNTNNAEKIIERLNKVELRGRNK